MRMQDIIMRELNRRGGPLNTLETGTIRSAEPQYAAGDGWSTVAFAQYRKAHGGSFTSIDLDIMAALTVLTDAALCGSDDLVDYVNLLEGNSLEVLPGVVEKAVSSGELLDVVLLDSDNSSSLIMDEFSLVKRAIRPGGVLLVDDVEPTSTSVKKGHAILPYLRSSGLEPEVVEREGNGFTTGVLRVVVP